MPYQRRNFHTLLDHHHHRRTPLRSHNACIPQANSLPHQGSHDCSASDQDKERSKAQKVQGKDGIGVGGRRRMFGWEGLVDTHYLHNLRLGRSCRYTLSTQSLHNARSPHIHYTFLTRLSPGRDIVTGGSISPRIGKLGRCHFP